MQLTINEDRTVTVEGAEPDEEFSLELIEGADPRFLSLAILRSSGPLRVGLRLRGNNGTWEYELRERDRLRMTVHCWLTGYYPEEVTNAKVAPLGTKYHVTKVDGSPLHEDEPCFVLRAQDWCSVQTIEDYEEACRESDCSEEHIAAVHRVRQQFCDWQAENIDKVKRPD
jgi:hypothetical protein